MKLSLWVTWTGFDLLLLVGFFFFFLVKELIQLPLGRQHWLQSALGITRKSTSVVFVDL